MLAKLKRISISDILVIIKRKLNNLTVVYSYRIEVFMIYIKKKI